jgi:hypothetical protein
MFELRDSDQADEHDLCCIHVWSSLDRVGHPSFGLSQMAYPPGTYFSGLVVVSIFEVEDRNRTTRDGPDS